MILIFRILTMTLAVVLGVIVFSALFEFFNALPSRGPNDLLWGALGWGVMFRAPQYLFFGTVPLLLALAILEGWKARRWAPHLVIWVAAGVLAIGSHRSIESLLAALLAASAAGFVYWGIAGRTAGNWISAWRSQRRESGLKPGLYVAYAVLAYLAYQLVGYAHYGGKLLWVSYVSEPGPGAPPVAFRRLTAAHKVALMDFPDVASCLTRDADETSPNYLEQLDWDRINNSSEAEVCTFRLLASYENLSHATKWFEAQGFKVPDHFSSARPYVGFDGNLRVHGSYSIRENGPKFPTQGIFRRAFLSIPYSMSSATTWSKDGTRLLAVEVGFNTL